MESTEFAIKAFGQLQALIGDTVISVENVRDVKALRALLFRRYPTLASVPFRIAVNLKFVTDEHVLQPGDEIALMPPFSGG